MRLITLLISLFFISSLYAQPTGYKPVANLATFKQQFAAAAQKTQNIKADFTQEKNLAMLEDKIVSKGKFCFSKPGKVRMEYTIPFKYLMIMNGNEVYIKDGQKENKMNTRSNKLFQQINKIMVDCIQGTALDNKEFASAVFENAQGFIIQLTPSSKALKDFFKTINIAVSKKDYGVLKLDMVEPGGDNTVISFLNKEVNTNIPETTFNAP